MNTTVAFATRVLIACCLYPYIQQRTGLATALDGYKLIDANGAHYGAWSVWRNRGNRMQ